MALNYCEWQAKETPSRWSMDMCTIENITKGLEWGFDMAACNPRLVFMAMMLKKDKFIPMMQEFKDLKGDEKAYAIMKKYLMPISELMMPRFKETKGSAGLTCVMLNPRIAKNADAMIKQALECNSWAPNMTIKLPQSGAAMEAAEELAAQGVHITGTVGFTVAQAMALASAHRKGIKRAKANGITPRGGNYALFTVRADQHIQDAAEDQGIAYISPEVSKWVGVAIAKRIYEVYNSEGFTDQDDMWLTPAGMTDLFHTQQLAGGKVVFDAYEYNCNDINREAEEQKADREYHIDEPVDSVIIDKLMNIRTFREMYEYNGLGVDEFYNFGPVQNIMANFGEAGFQRLLTDIC